MKKTKQAGVLVSIKKDLAKITINPSMNSIKDAPFIKNKMAKGDKMIAIAGLPK